MPWQNNLNLNSIHCMKLEMTKFIICTIVWAQTPLGELTVLPQTPGFNWDLGRRPNREYLVVLTPSPNPGYGSELWFIFRLSYTCFWEEQFRPRQNNALFFKCTIIVSVWPLGEHTKLAEFGWDRNLVCTAPFWQIPESATVMVIAIIQINTNWC